MFSKTGIANVMLAVLMGVFVKEFVFFEIGREVVTESPTEIVIEAEEIFDVTPAVSGRSIPMRNFINPFFNRSYLCP
jgi:hypothetical protein